VLTALALTVLLGGANAVAVRFTVSELPPFWGATLRFAAAAPIFWALAVWRRESLPRGRTLQGVLLYGLLGFGANYALLYWGIRDVGAGLTQVILALTPLFTFLLAVVHRLEPFRWRAVLGAALAVGGITLAFIERIESDVPPASLLAVVVAAACFAEAIVVVKRYPAAPPLITNAVAVSTGAAVLLAASLLAGETRAWPALPETRAAVAYLVVGGTVILFYLTLYIIRRLTASATSYLFVLFPFVTVILASWLVAEPVTAALLLGVALVIVGVWVGALSRPTKQ
jgi:drug/metabolite transporter (DMT)-like permease